MNTKENLFAPEYEIIKKIRACVGKQETLYGHSLIDIIDRELAWELMNVNDQGNEITVEQKSLSNLNRAKSQLRRVKSKLGQLISKKEVSVKPKPSVSKSVETITSFHNKYIFCATVDNNLKTFSSNIINLYNRGEEVVVFAPLSSKSWPSRQELQKKGIEFVLLPNEQEVKLTLESNQEKIITSFIQKLSMCLENPRLDIKKKSRQKLKLFINQNLRNVLVYRIGLANYLYQRFKNQIPKAVISGRPKRTIPLSMLFAARKAGITTVFISHSLWFKRDAKYLPALYDLKMFDHICVFSKNCHNCIRKYNNTSEVHIFGWPQRQPIGLKKAEKLSDDLSRLSVLYPLQKDYSFFLDLCRVFYEVGIDLVIKCHPSTSEKDKEELANAIPLTYQENISIYHHTEISLQEAVMQSDFVIGNLSNASIEAIVIGRPIIGYLSANEREILKFRPHSITSADVPGLMAWSLEELRLNLEAIKQDEIELNQLYTEQISFIKNRFNNKLGEDSVKEISSILYEQI